MCNTFDLKAYLDFELAGEKELESKHYANNIRNFVKIFELTTWDCSVNLVNIIDSFNLMFYKASDQAKFAGFAKNSDYFDHLRKFKSSKYGCDFLVNMPYVRSADYLPILKSELSLKVGAVIIEPNKSLRNSLAYMQIFAPSKVINSNNFKQDLKLYLA